jgi:hypothetical protein
MADIIDVQQGLAALAAQAVYPNGTGQPSVAGVDILIYPGWPQQANLDADLLAGKVHVSIFPTAMERNTTRYPRDDWQELAVNAATLTLTIAGQTVTVGGAMPSPFHAQNVMVMVNGLPYVYATQANDTLTSIATALAALIPGASNVGAVITVVGIISEARVGTSGTLIRETRRQERVFMLTVWADTPVKRDAVAKAIDELMATTQFLTMPDEYAARLIYRGSPVTDGHQKANLYRRDLNYSVEYATTQQAAAVQATQMQATLEAKPDGATAPISTITVNS